MGAVHTVRDATAWAEMMRLDPDSFPPGHELLATGTSSVVAPGAQAAQA